MTSDLLYIARSESTESIDDNADMFVVEDALTSASFQRVEELIDVILEADVEGKMSIPFFQLTRYRLVLPFLNNSLVHMVLLYEQLEQRVVSTNPDTIRCSDVDESTESVVRDIAAKTGVEIAGIDDSGQDRLKRYLGMVARSGLSLLDCSLAASRNLFIDRTDDADLVLYPRADRFDSYKPLVDSLSDDLSLFDLQAHAILSSDQNVMPDRDIPESIHKFATLEDVSSIVRSIFYELPREISARSMEKQVADHLQSELGITVNHSIAHAFNVVYDRAFSAIRSSILSQRMIEETSIQKAIVGAMGVNERAVIMSGEEVDFFHLPHTVITGYPNLGPADVVNFEAGRPDVKHAENLAYSPDGYDGRAVGRLRLTRLYEEQFSRQFERGEELRLLITTQPVTDGIRRNFIKELLDVLTEIQHVSAAIKIHPDEQRSFYQPLVESHDDTVPVIDGDIVQQLKSSDIVVTLFSNTGIESIAVGTPSISFNLWSPTIRPPPFIEQGPIPYFESTRTLCAFFETFDEKTRNELLSEQIQFLKQEYFIDGEPVDKMVSVIEG